MAESVVTFLLGKLSSFLEEEMKSLGGVREEVEFIKDELSSMTTLLRHADAVEESEKEFHTWVKQVRNVAYDTEDILDEFVLHLAGLHRQRGFYGSLCKIYYQIKGIKARRQIASNIRGIKPRVVEIAERHQRYSNKFVPSEQGSSSSAFVTNTNAMYDQQNDALLLEESELVGIDKPKQELIGWLLSGDSPMKVISVFGTGGLGKTTLVKKVYDDEQVKNHFQSHAWITVSQSPKIEELLRDLIQQLFKEGKRPPPQGLEKLDGNKLKAELKAFLQQSSRYVLVLDDVWSIRAWHAIKIALPNRDCGNRVLLTTRIYDVASTSCADYGGHIYDMKVLSAEESWALFCKKAFHEKECPPHLRELSKSFLRRCEGLPLAIVAIAGVLASKDQSNVYQWESVNRSLGDEVQGSEKFQSMRKILLLSYNDLPYYLKSCFLYLSGFPEDHLIEWMSTIRLWIAEGFVEVKRGKTLEEVAESYLYDLLDRSLIQIAEKRKDRRVKSCRIHDLLREVIVSKARDQDFLMIVEDENLSWPERVRRLSIHNNLQTTQQGKCVSQLRSLLVFGVVDPLSESSMPLLFDGDLRLLKVLYLRDAYLEVFPSQVFKLVHLKYLSLRGTKVKVLPKSIGMLRNLETLDLKDTLVTKLPVEILELRQLRHLLVYRYQTVYTYYPFHTIHGFEAPSKIASLQSLQKLCFIEANHVTIVKEIGRLTQLRRLGIVKLRREDGLALCSSIKKLTYLRSLAIISIEEDEILDLQSLSPSSQFFLQQLFLSGRLEKLPHWITSLHSLVTLSLWWSKLRDAGSLQSLQDLPNLVRLSLDEAYEGEELCFKAGGFQSLKTLEIVKLKGLKWLKVEEGAMTRLEKLIITNCELMEELPTGVEHLRNLEYLELDDMSVTLISKLNRDEQGGEYLKIAHITKVWIGDSKDGYWKGNFL